MLNQDQPPPIRHRLQSPLREGLSRMRITQLRGLRVISLAEALKMGKVENVLLDPTGRWVAALQLRGGGTLSGKHLVLREAVKRVGQHAIILGAPIGMGDNEQELELDRLIDLKTFIGLEVVTDEGMLLGHIHDAEIDPETLKIIEYELVRNFWDAYLQTGLRVAAQDTLSGSKDVLIVPEGALQKSKIVSGNIDVPKEW